MTRRHNCLANFLVLLISLSVSSVTYGQLIGDIDGDGVRNCRDIDVWNFGYSLYRQDPDAYGFVVDVLDMDQFVGGANAGAASLFDRSLLVQVIFGTNYGDANLDNVVDEQDLQIVQDNWQMQNASWKDGDFNGDGIVNSFDLNIVGLNWLKPCLETVAPCPDDVPDWAIQLHLWELIDEGVLIEDFERELVVENRILELDGDVNQDGSVDCEDFTIIFHDQVEME